MSFIPWENCEAIQYFTKVTELNTKVYWKFSNLGSCNIVSNIIRCTTYHRFVRVLLKTEILGGGIYYVCTQVNWHKIMGDCRENLLKCGYNWNVNLVCQLKCEENSPLVNSHRLNVEDDFILLSVIFELNLHLVSVIVSILPMTDWLNLWRELEPMKYFLGEDWESHGASCCNLKSLS